jgi:hemerythrin-like domain-containing protein
MVMNIQEKFIKAFKQEHQQILDGLLVLRSAIQKIDIKQASEIVEKLDNIMGPHFRVEEDALYPMLTEYLGQENVNNLLNEHRGAVEVLHSFKKYIGDEAWLSTHREEALKKLEGFFMHVTGCDGLSIIIERFSDQQKAKLADYLDYVHTQPQSLTQWKAISDYK